MIDEGDVAYVRRLIARLSAVETEMLYVATSDISAAAHDEILQQAAENTRKEENSGTKH